VEGFIYIHKVNLFYMLLIGQIDRKLGKIDKHKT